MTKQILISIKEKNLRFTYNQLMAKLLQLPKFLQLEIGKALVKNTTERFEKLGDSICNDKNA